MKQEGRMMTQDFNQEYKKVMRKCFLTAVSFFTVILVVPVGSIIGVVICTGLWWQEVVDTWKRG